MPKKGEELVVPKVAENCQLDHRQWKESVMYCRRIPIPG